MGGFPFFVRNFQTLLSFLLPFLEKIPSKLLPSHIQTMISLVSRTGRHFQRYDNRGYRLVVGCIPYRYKKSTNKETNTQDIEVLVISAQKSQAMMFPKGGWETDEESMKDAALRETLEEAGVTGSLGCELGKWYYMSKRGGIMHEGYMFPLLVEKQFDLWPEKNIRKRRWVTVKEAKEVCPQLWMREALDELVRRHMHNSHHHQQQKVENDSTV